jgi:hypothetical protein
MLSVYVAGRTTDIDKVRRIQQLFKDNGYVVTFDWTGPNGEIRKDWYGVSDARGAQLAQTELNAVKRASITVLVWKDPEDNRQGMIGALIEAGAALAFGNELWVLNPSRDSVFFHHKNAKVFTSEDELSKAIADYLADYV